MKSESHKSRPLTIFWGCFRNTRLREDCFFLFLIFCFCFCFCFCFYFFFKRSSISCFGISTAGVINKQYNNQYSISLQTDPLFLAQSLMMAWRLEFLQVNVSLIQIGRTTRRRKKETNIVSILTIAFAGFCFHVCIGFLTYYY